MKKGKGAKADKATTTVSPENEKNEKKGMGVKVSRLVGFCLEDRYWEDVGALCFACWVAERLVRGIL